MKKIQLLLLGSLLGLCASCSDDDTAMDTTVPPEDLVFPSFTAIEVLGPQGTRAYLYDGISQEGQLINFAETYGISGNYIGVTASLPTIGFYYENGSALVVDIEQSQRTMVPNYFDNVNGGFHRWSRNYKQTLVNGFYREGSEQQLRVSVHELFSFETQTFDLLDFHIESKREVNNGILTIYDPSQEEGRVAVFNLEDRTFLGRIVLDAPVLNVFVGDQDELWIRSSNGITQYNLVDLSKVNTVADIGDVGITNYDRAIGTNVYFANDYSQPATFAYSPGVLNIETGTVSRIDMANSLNAYIAQQGWEGFYLGDYAYDQATDSWLMAYRIIAVNAEQFGVLHIGNNGSVLAHKEIPVVPRFFEILD